MGHWFYSSLLFDEKPSVLNTILLNTANVLYIFCFGVRDVLWLRMLAIAAMVLLLPFYANQPEPMISCMVWQTVFIAINLYWVVVIIRERMPPQMSPDEQVLYDTVFKKTCSAKDMLKLLSKGQWQNASPGKKIIAANMNLDELILMQSGSVTFQVQDGETIKLHRGCLLGAVSYLTEEATVADYIAEDSVRYLTWQREDLLQLFKVKPELKSALYEIIGLDLVNKLIFQHNHLDMDNITFHAS